MRFLLGRSHNPVVAPLLIFDSPNKRLRSPVARVFLQSVLAPAPYHTTPFIPSTVVPPSARMTAHFWSNSRYGGRSKPPGPSST